MTRIFGLPLMFFQGKRPSGAAPRLIRPFPPIFHLYKIHIISPPLADGDRSALILSTRVLSPSGTSRCPLSPSCTPCVAGAYRPARSSANSYTTRSPCLRLVSSFAQRLLGFPF